MDKNQPHNEHMVECRQKIMDIVNTSNLSALDKLSIDKYVSEICEIGGVQFKDMSVQHEEVYKDTCIRVLASTIKGDGPFWYELSNRTCHYDSCNMLIPAFESIEVCLKAAKCFIDAGEELLQHVSSEHKCKMIQ